MPLRPTEALTPPQLTGRVTPLVALDVSDQLEPDPNDLIATSVAPITPLVTEIVAAVGPAPAELLRWVRDRFTPRDGFGMQRTLDRVIESRTGTSAELAAVLLALLRAADVPARIVVYEPTHWPGSAELNALGQHVVVEAYVPMIGYGGQLDEPETEQWVLMDPFGANEIYRRPRAPAPQDALGNWPDTVLVDAYLGGTHRQPFARYLTAEAPVAGFPALATSPAGFAPALTSFGEPFLSNALAAAGLGPLGSYEVNYVYEGVDLPDDLRIPIRFELQDGGTEIWHHDTYLDQIGGQRISLGFQPAYASGFADLALLGGIEHAPCESIELIPVLKVGGLDRAVGSRPVKLCDALTVVASGGTDVYPWLVERTMLAGESWAFNLGGELAVSAPTVPAETETEVPGVQRLSDVAHAYSAGLLAEEARLARWHGADYAHPWPDIVVAGCGMELLEVMGYPMQLTFTGLNLDVLSHVDGASGFPSGAASDSYLALHGLMSSDLEAQVFADVLGLEAVSTVRLFQHAADLGLAPQLLASVDALPADVPADVADAVAELLGLGYSVEMVTAPITVEDFTGYGWVARDERQRTQGYFLSGGLAGAWTVLSPNEWVLDADLQPPLTGQPSNDPADLVGVAIYGLPEHGFAEVGAPLPLTLASFAAGSRPVAGVGLRLSPTAGGTVGGVAEPVVVTTDSDGLARVTWTLGERIVDRQSFEFGATVIGVQANDLVLRGPADHLAVDEFELGRATVYGYPGAPVAIAPAGDKRNGSFGFAADAVGAPGDTTVATGPITRPVYSAGPGDPSELFPYQVVDRFGNGLPHVPLTVTLLDHTAVLRKLVNQGFAGIEQHYLGSAVADVSDFLGALNTFATATTGEFAAMGCGDSSGMDPACTQDLGSPDQPQTAVASTDFDGLQTFVVRHPHAWVLPTRWLAAPVPDNPAVYRWNAGAAGVIGDWVQDSGDIDLVGVKSRYEIAIDATQPYCLIPDPDQPLDCLAAWRDLPSIVTEATSVFGGQAASYDFTELEPANVEWPYPLSDQLIPATLTGIPLIGYDRQTPAAQPVQTVLRAILPNPATPGNGELNLNPADPATVAKLELRAYAKSDANTIYDPQFLAFPGGFPRPTSDNPPPVDVGAVWWDAIGPTAKLDATLARTATDDTGAPRTTFAFTVTPPEPADPGTQTLVATLTYTGHADDPADDPLEHCWTPDQCFRTIATGQWIDTGKLDTAGFVQGSGPNAMLVPGFFLRPLPLEYDAVEAAVTWTNPEIAGQPLGDVFVAGLPGHQTNRPPLHFDVTWQPATYTPGNVKLIISSTATGRAIRTFNADPEHAGTGTATITIDAYALELAAGQYELTAVLNHGYAANEVASAAVAFVAAAGSLAYRLERPGQRNQAWPLLLGTSVTATALEAVVAVSAPGSLGASIAAELRMLDTAGHPIPPAADGFAPVRQTITLLRQSDDADDPDYHRFAAAERLALIGGPVTATAGNKRIYLHAVSGTVELRTCRETCSKGADWATVAPNGWVELAAKVPVYPLRVAVDVGLRCTGRQQLESCEQIVWDLWDNFDPEPAQTFVVPWKRKGSTDQSLLDDAKTWWGAPEMPSGSPGNLLRLRLVGIENLRELVRIDLIRDLALPVTFDLARRFNEGWGAGNELLRDEAAVATATLPMDEQPFAWLANLQVQAELGKIGDGTGQAGNTERASGLQAYSRSSATWVWPRQRPKLQVLHRQGSLSPTPTPRPQTARQPPRPKNREAPRPYPASPWPWPPPPSSPSSSSPSATANAATATPEPRSHPVNTTPFETWQQAIQRQHGHIEAQLHAATDPDDVRLLVQELNQIMNDLNAKAQHAANVHAARQNAIADLRRANTHLLNGAGRRILELSGHP